MCILQETGHFIQYMQIRNMPKSKNGLSTDATKTIQIQVQVQVFDALLQSHPMFKELIRIYYDYIEGDAHTYPRFQMYYNRMRQVIPNVPDGQSPLLDQLIRLVCTQQFLSR